MHAGRDGIGETQLSRDVGTALATGLDQFLRDVRAVAHDVHDGAQALAHAGAQAGVAEHEAQHLRQAVLDDLVVALELQIVGQIELADARGVAAAAQVLQQQGVVQLPQLRLGQADLPADVHADPAAAHAVALGLALRDVQRMAECADQLREQQFANLARRRVVGKCVEIESLHRQSLSSVRGIWSRFSATTCQRPGSVRAASSDSSRASAPTSAVAKCRCPARRRRPP